MAKQNIEFIETPLGNYPKQLSSETSLGFPTDGDWTRRYPWLKDGRKRSYELLRYLGRGAFSIAFEARVVRGGGFHRVPVVIKFPIADANPERRKIWLKFTREAYEKEFSLIGHKLIGCKHANPIIDLLQSQIPQLPHADGLCILTVQPYLRNAKPLDEWIKNKLGVKIERDNGRLIESWGGIKNKDLYLSLACALSEAIKDVHLHRVTHADLHPGNIFVSTSGKLLVTLIDFGESFTAMPGKYSRRRTPRPYLSPERRGPRYPLSDQVDVYSFGILLLYLATGSENIIQHKSPGDDREFIDNCLSNNPNLLKAEPRLVDLISHCIARDPADRPNCLDIFEDIRIMRDGAHKIVTAGHIASILKNVSSQLPAAALPSQLPYNPILLKIVERSARELEAIISGLATDMIEVNGTRYEVLRVLIQLIDSMSKGDSWTTITTLSVWQRNALGLNGSYTSATFNAIQRGAAIRRVFILSVEEIGLPFAKELAAQLGGSRLPQLQRLAGRLNHAIQLYGERVTELADAPHRLPASARPRPLKSHAGGFAKWHRNRLQKLINHLVGMTVRWNVTEQQLAKPDTEGRYAIETTSGLYIGVHVVPTLDEVGEVREDNPAALLHFPRESNPAQRWVLVTTNIGNRASRGEDDNEFDRPHLLGLRVFKSAGADEHGKPPQRLEELNNLLNHKHMAVNVTQHLRAFQKAIRRANAVADKSV